MARSFGNLRFEGGDKKQPRCDPRLYVGSLGATYVSDQLSSGQGRDRERCVLCTMGREEYDSGCFLTGFPLNLLCVSRQVIDLKKH